MSKHQLEDRFDLHAAEAAQMEAVYGWTPEDQEAAVNDGWALELSADAKWLIFSPVNNGDEFEVFAQAPETLAKMKAIWLMEAHGTSTEKRRMHEALEEFG